MKELELALASVFKRSGKQSISEKDFELYVSMELHWFSPAEAKKLLSNGVAASLLVLKGGSITPNFNVGAVDVPLTFKPTKAVIGDIRPKPVFLRIVDEISSRRGVERSQVISEINKRQAQIKLDIEVVALLVARGYDLDISAYIADVEKEIVARAAEESRPAQVRF